MIFEIIIKIKMNYGENIGMNVYDFVLIILYINEYIILFIMRIY